MAQSNTASTTRINPAEGSEVEVEAGEGLTLAFDVANESPEIISYHIAAEELPTEWIAEAPVLDAAPGSNERVKVVVRPFVNAMDGVYPMRLSILADGSSYANVSLNLRVLPPPPGAILQPPPPVVVPVAAPPVAPVYDLEPEPVEPVNIVESGFVPPSEPIAPVAIPEPFAPTPVIEPLVEATDDAPAEALVEKPKRRPASPKPAPVTSPVAETAPTVVEVAPPVTPSRVVPTQVTPPVAPPINTTPAPVVTPRVTPVQTAPPVQIPPVVTPQPAPPRPQHQPVAPPVVAQSRPQPQPVTPPRPAAAPLPLTPEPLPVTDEFSNYSYRPSTQDAEIDEPDEPNAIVAGTKDGNDGDVFTVAPGQTLLVRITVQNDGTYARNYVLEDDQLLDQNWLDLRQYDINLDRNALGELRFRLTPPTDAEPGAYPFGVRFGPSDASRRVKQFTLLIPALPLVELKAEKTEQSVLSLAVKPGIGTEFPLQVVSTGNADTSFRVGVVAAGGQTAASDPDTPYLYETDKWRYEFDRELEEVRVPENHQAARPEPVRLRVARKGVWWWGFKEAHEITVAATPVMGAAPTSGGEAAPRASSQATVTLKRWRPIPFPAVFLIPLLLILLPIFGGGARDVVVENGVQGTGSLASGDSSTSGNLYYVLQNGAVTVDPAKPPKDITADLAWSATAGSWLYLATDKSKTLASGPFLRGFTDTASVSEYGLTRTYTVGSPLSRQSVTVRYLPLRTNNLGIVVRQNNKPVTAKVFDVPGGTEKGGREYVLAKTGAATLSLTNGYTNGLDVVVWLATNTGGASVNNIATVDAKRLLPGTTLPTITVAPPASGSAEVTLLTTDAKGQVIRLRFE